MSGQILHASAVSFEGRGVLILGASGAGKSTLALQLMALGADLVADDRVSLAPNGMLSAAPNLAGLIEARGVGVLRAPHVSQARLALAVDLDQTETDRLPPHRSYAPGVPLLHNIAGPSFPMAIKLHLMFGRDG